MNESPWKCAGPCQQLMYNVEYHSVEGSLYPRRVPVEGAPAMWYVDNVGSCCSLCWAMYQAIDKPYFVRLHREWVDETDRRNRLRLGGDYLGGK